MRKIRAMSGDRNALVGVRRSTPGRRPILEIHMAGWESASIPHERFKGVGLRFDEAGARALRDELSGILQDQAAKP